ncbi:MAG: tetratricopeptide repeat protein, partial [Deltaproteobacteria bacterium]
LKYFEGHYPPFNGGWRWTYRKKAVGILKQELYEDDDFKASVFKNALGLTGADKETLSDEALRLAGGMEAGGEAEKAEVIRKIVSFFNDEMDVREFNTFLLHAGSHEYRLLGKFLIGYHYEKMGFYPEARGHYSMVLKGSKDGFARSAALFAGARLKYMEGRFAGAKKLLQRPLEEDFPGARIWLANTLLVKGEIDGAWKLYSEGADRALEDFDPITVLSMGDILVLMRKYGEARSLFKSLGLNHEKDEFLEAFFNLKSGDTFLAEGRLDEAFSVFSHARDKYKTGEGWSMSSLSMADVLVMKQDKESLSRALAIYEQVAQANLPGSEHAYLGLASVQIRLGRYEDAIKSADVFSSRYADSHLKPDMNGYKADAVSRMLESLYASGDHLGAAGLFVKYGASIPFGKKAEGYLKAGKSFDALDLWPDAVNRLNSAIRIGRDDVAEEAMITLARVYLKQKDTGSAARLLKNFVGRFPKSVHKAEAENILFKSTFDAGEYEKVALTKNHPGGTGGLLLKARAFARLGRHKEALAAYEKAASDLMGNGGKDLLAEAYLGMGDENFVLGRYAMAADGYKKAVGAMEGPDKGISKSWALYRMAQSYSILKDDSGKEEARKALTGLNSEFGAVAAPILKEARDL